jgi:hypothetical protein
LLLYARARGYDSDVSFGRICRHDLQDTSWTEFQCRSLETRLDVRFSLNDVRSTPKSGHSEWPAPYPLRARSGHSGPARPISVLGTLRPSALVVLRLITLGRSIISATELQTFVALLALTQRRSLWVFVTVEIQRGRTLI